jgi:hypothetical protein
VEFFLNYHSEHELRTAKSTANLAVDLAVPFATQG